MSYIFEAVADPTATFSAGELAQVRYLLFRLNAAARITTDKFECECDCAEALTHITSRDVSLKAVSEHVRFNIQFLLTCDD